MLNLNIIIVTLIVSAFASATVVAVALITRPAQVSAPQKPAKKQTTKSAPKKGRKKLTAAQRAERKAKSEKYLADRRAYLADHKEEIEARKAAKEQAKAAFNKSNAIEIIKANPACTRKDAGCTFMTKEQFHQLKVEAGVRK